MAKQLPEAATVVLITNCGVSRFAAILSQIPGHDVDCARERELSTEIARRSGRTFQGIAVPMSVFHEPIEKRVVTSVFGSPPDGGGNLIGTDHLGAQFIDRLMGALVVRRAGARVLTGLTGNVSIPKLVSSTSAWIAENSAITPGDPTFGSVRLSPKHCGTIVEFSRNLLLQSSPDIETLLRQDFAAELATRIDAAALIGGGSNEPTGIMANTDVDGTTSMATPTWATVLELIETVEAGNGVGNAFVGSPQVVKALRSTAKVGSSDSVMIMEAPNSLAGYPFFSTTLMTGTASPAAGNLIFGNFNDLLLGIWSEFDVLVNPFESTAYTKGNVMVRGMATVDVALRHAESFAYADDVGL